MNELRGRLLLGGRLVHGAVHWSGERIVSLELDSAPEHGVQAPIIAPGFVDLHVHGFGGHSPVGALRAMAGALARVGTTAFQPTLFPAEPARLGALAAQVWREAELSNGEAEPRARIVGLHLEGPFVNPLRAGALPREDLAVPSLAALRALMGPATGDGRGIRTVTLAPELSGACDLIAELVRGSVRVSLGHSAATADDARAAARAGAVGATHLFNAMSGIHHREVGLAGFALTSTQLAAELIGDLVHVGADAIRLALAARGPKGLCLVSDALEGAGSGCDVFHSHGRAHERRGGAWYYPAGAGGEPKLAGSALSQLEMVQGLVRHGVVSVEEALTMASETPARALGLEKELGLLAPGLRADFVVLEPRELELQRVLVAGRPVENRRPGA
ncbi:MAG: N-acetylglucosamine-6-phosphate deacetylase [Planctomycetes bacterium]|nr:N-acetylglucosamine-6-phosphate deacetylase [Planctomycetota bacterium]